MLLALSQTDSAGRFYVAANDIPSGTLVLSEIPFVSVVAAAKIDLVCAYCFKEKKGLTVCKSCRCVSFCSAECAELSLHTQTECSMLSNLDTSLLSAADTTLAMLMVRLLVLRTRLPNEFESFLQLCLAEISDDRYEEMLMVAETVLAAVPPQLRMPEDDVVDLMRREQCNSFGLWSSSNDTMLGFAVYLNMSYFNHSCLPNICISRDKTSYEMRALCDIAKGSVVTISYTDHLALHDPVARAQTLMKSYCFQCQCELCCAEPSAQKQMVKTFNKNYRCKHHHCNGLCYVNIEDPTQKM